MREPSVFRLVDCARGARPSVSSRCLTVPMLNCMAGVLNAPANGAVVCLSRHENFEFFSAAPQAVVCLSRRDDFDNSADPKTCSADPTTCSADPATTFFRQLAETEQPSPGSKPSSKLVCENHTASRFCSSFLRSSGFRLERSSPAAAVYAWSAVVDCKTLPQPERPLVTTVKKTLPGVASVRRRALPRLPGTRVPYSEDMAPDPQPPRRLCAWEAVFDCV